MNAHHPERNPDTGPPVLLKKTLFTPVEIKHAAFKAKVLHNLLKRFTADEATLLVTVFDFPELILMALKGDKQARYSLGDSLRNMAKGNENDPKTRETLALLARHGLQEARNLL